MYCAAVGASLTSLSYGLVSVISKVYPIYPIGWRGWVAYAVSSLECPCVNWSLALGSKLSSGALGALTCFYAICASRRLVWASFFTRVDRT
jgi:hypothetical protein